MSDTTKSDRSQPTVHRRWTVDQLPPTTDSAQASRHRLFNGPTLIAHAQAGPHSLTSGFDHALSDEPIDGDAIVVLLDDDASPGRTDGIKAPPGTNGRQ